MSLTYEEIKSMRKGSTIWVVRDTSNESSKPWFNVEVSAFEIVSVAPHYINVRKFREVIPTHYATRKWFKTCPEALAEASLIFANIAEKEAEKNDKHKRNDGVHGQAKRIKRKPETNTGESFELDV